MDGRPIYRSRTSNFPLETFRRADILGHGWARGDLVGLPRSTSLDPLTVEIHADSDVAKQLFLLGYLPILPAHYWLERDVNEPTMAPPLQSGPYRLTSGVSGSLRHIRARAGLLG